MKINIRGAAAAMAAAAIVATTSLTTAPAVAASAHFPDLHGDMEHGADIWNVRVTHEDEIRIKITHDNLVRQPRHESGLSLFLDTNRAIAGPEYVFTAGLFPGSDYQLSRAVDWRPAGNPNRCAYRLELDYARDVARIHLGRGCFHHPQAIRVAVRVTGRKHDGSKVRDWLGARREFTNVIRHG